MTDHSKPRGFAAMTPERRREISAMGGGSKKRDPATRAFCNLEKASDAGRKGGLKSRLPGREKPVA